PIGLPDMALMLTDALVAFDHQRHELTVLANVDAESDDLEAAYAAAVATIEEVRWKLAGPVPRPARPPAPRDPDRRVELQSNMSRERFEAMVERIVEYIHAGDAYQVLPSQRWSGAVPGEAFS